MRLLVLVLVLAVVLAGLLLGADRVAASRAEAEVAQRLESSGQLTAADVQIAGFPFLTQALAGRYERVDVLARTLDTEEGVRLEEVEATLAGVRLPLRQVLRGGDDPVPVDRLDARALLPYDELERRADVPGLELGPGEAGPDGEVLRLAGDVRVAGRSVDAAAEAELRVEGEAVRITPRRATLAGVEVEGRVADALAEALDLRVDVGGLPFGLRLQSVEVTEEGVVAVAEARDTVLDPVAAGAAAP